VIGDGKMGQAIRQLALDKGWKVTAILGERENAGGAGITARSLGNPQVAVEFTQPDAAVGNITACLKAGVPIVVGTTGWYDSLPEVTRIAKESGTALLWAASDALDRPIPTTSVRTGSVPGTHELIFDGAFEQLSLTHLARDRRVFAEGALKAADWLIGKKGVFTMRDVLERVAPR
jgi:4-hydroxy-tetrahydrodipicolinate reductase